MTFGFEIHPFQPLYAGRHDLLYFRLCLGYVSIYFAPYVLTAKLAELTAALRGVVGK